MKPAYLTWRALGRCVFWIALGSALKVTASPSPSVARVWNEEVLAAIRIDLPHPPAHARNLFHLSVAMYDAWAAYDPTAAGCLYHAKHTAGEVAAARREAVAYAGYRILAERYALSRGALTTLPALRTRLAALGYDPENRTLDPSTPAGVGNRVAFVVSAFALEDGALQLRNYRDLPASEGGYTSVNQPLPVGFVGLMPADVNRWQPLAITAAQTQNGISVDEVQVFVGSQWKGVRPFALGRADADQLWIDPGPPPLLGGSSDAAFRENVVEVLRRSAELTPDDGAQIDLSPGAWGNNALGRNDGLGHPLNPATGAPYAPNPVKRGDFARVLAEFWADGPRSETPPGHWNVLANAVVDHPQFERRLGGQGSVLDPLEWDVKMYFALNAALHDAACVAWSVKRHYDGWRPIAAIRYMARMGQSSDPGAPRYHRFGLPLIADLIEVVTLQTARQGGRHQGLALNTLAVRSWPGQPTNAAVPYSGVRWRDASLWVPYQKTNFVTPAFPGYISGHSTFSRAAAEVMTAITGSPFFPGGLGTFTAPARTFLTFEQGPSETVQLQWGTYYDAADQAGLSRIWGGIHPPVDDFAGRRAGSEAGLQAWALARRYFDGSVATEPVSISIRPLVPGTCEIRYTTVRGMSYKLQSTRRLDQPFVDHDLGFVQAVEDRVVLREADDATARFYRVVQSAESP
ncbi:MAG: vanadium-dependent haloperoxidase [Verrucomicrobiales bacterium]|nr:vanadium-dependent haloperoxidase [Verrucomicrobiales bacterium]